MDSAASEHRLYHKKNGKTLMGNMMILGYGEKTIFGQPHKGLNIWDIFETAKHHPFLFAAGKLEDFHPF